METLTMVYCHYSLFIWEFWGAFDGDRAFLTLGLAYPSGLESWELASDFYALGLQI